MRWIAMLTFVLLAPSVHSGICRNVTSHVVQNERVLHVQPQSRKQSIRQQSNQKVQVKERVIEKVVFQNATQPLYPHAYGLDRPVFQDVYTHTSGDLQRRNLIARSVHQGDTARFERFAKFFPVWKTFEKFEEYQQNSPVNPSNANVPAEPEIQVVKASKLVQDKCAKCHFTDQTTSPGGEIYLDLPLDGQQLQSVIDAMKNGSMPKGGNPLSVDEQESVAGYLAIQSLLQPKKDR